MYVRKVVGTVLMARASLVGFRGTTFVLNLGPGGEAERQQGKPLFSRPTVAAYFHRLNGLKDLGGETNKQTETKSWPWADGLQVCAGSERV